MFLQESGVEGPLEMSPGLQGGVALLWATESLECRLLFWGTRVLVLAVGECCGASLLLGEVLGVVAVVAGIKVRSPLFIVSFSLRGVVSVEDVAGDSSPSLVGRAPSPVEFFFLCINSIGGELSCPQTPTLRRVGPRF